MDVHLCTLVSIGSRIYLGCTFLIELSPARLMGHNPSTVSLDISTLDAGYTSMSLVSVYLSYLGPFSGTIAPSTPQDQIPVPFRAPRPRPSSSPGLSRPPTSYPQSARPQARLPSPPGRILPWGPCTFPSRGSQTYRPHQVQSQLGVYPVLDQRASRG